MFELAKVAGYLLSPLTIVLVLGLIAAAALALRRPRLAAGCAGFAFLLLWVASLPMVAIALEQWLEGPYPARRVEDAPQVDAILVLGGALAGAHPPQRPYFGFGPSAGRVWQTAMLYRAGKAKWVIVAGGNQPGEVGVQPEGDAIAEMLQSLGVPRDAVLRETRSRNTLENAQNAQPLAQQAGARRILLVTSAQHMGRALKTFRQVWGPGAFELIPWATDQPEWPTDPAKLWLPSLDSLGYVTKAVKEIAGTQALDIIRNVTFVM